MNSSMTSFVGSDYYDAFIWKKLTKHQRHLAGEEVSDPESPAPKPAKPSQHRKTKGNQGRTTVLKYSQGKPKPAPANLREEAQAGVMESSEDPHSQECLRRERGLRRGAVKRCWKGERESIGEEQAAQVLLHLQTPKKKSPAEQYIFQRRTPVPSEPAGHEESSSLYAELGLSGSQARPDPGKLDEGQAGPNPDDVAKSQPLPTPSVLTGPNLEHIGVEITDASSQPQPEHMDEGFTTTAYPNV
ncbi:hypothetical protein Tco_1295274 [Tanacetum coccineum]